jgi:hypothetical protein
MWSRSEKAIARKAFDAALKRRLHEVIQDAKQMASRIRQSSDLWDLEHYLTYRVKRSIASTTTGTCNSRSSSGNFSEIAPPLFLSGRHPL